MFYFLTSAKSRIQTILYSSHIVTKMYESNFCTDLEIDFVITYHLTSHQIEFNICKFSHHQFKDFLLIPLNFTQSHFSLISTINKKVLLLERKRHTAHRVASTPYVVLTGYPPARVPPGQGTPPARVPPQPGYPPTRVTPPARVPPSQGTPLARVPPLAGPGRVPPPARPGRVPPLLPHGILGNVAKHYGIRVPPPVDKLTK